MGTKGMESKTPANMKNLSDTVPIHQWFDDYHEDFLVISGPCSAESREQILQTAKGISAHPWVRVLRAGIWKPRTRPENFEGVGETGMEWMQEAREQTGLRLAVEVASAGHVEMALHHQMDMVWLGARTTSNPFSVQEIADALEGSDIPVLVKNPLNPDFNLWMGALERLYRAGIRKIGAVHRGFYPYEPTRYRNIPKWEIPIELKRHFPGLPVLCDPSHIAGDRTLIRHISQKALDLNMNGLMIEAHIDPSSAWSDARQQVTPEELINTLNHLKQRRSVSSNRQFLSTLDALREKIDTLDTRMLEIIAERMKVVEEIGRYKKDNQVTILQMKRWQTILNSRLEMGKKMGLNEPFLMDLLRMIHNESIQRQTEIMNNPDEQKED